MFKKISTKQLIFLTLIGALMFVIDFIISSGVDTATGIPGMGYLISGFFFVILGTIGVLIVKKFFSITIMGFIYATLSTPTVILGPPGPYKILMGILLGLFADIIILLFKYKNIGYYFTFAIASVITLPLWVWVLKLLGLPGVEQILSIIWVMVVVYIIQGIVGAWIGIKIYKKKLKNRRLIRQISG